MTPQQLIELSDQLEKIELQSGIYMILSAANNKAYIGQAKNIKRRWHSHTYMLKNGKHGNVHLQSIYNKYGRDSLAFFILETCQETNLNDREVYWHELLNEGISINIAEVGRKQSVTLPENIRAAQHLTKTRSKTGYKNVMERHGWFEVQIDHQRFGRFSSPEIAALHRDVIARNLLGDKTCYNFPFMDELPATSIQPANWTFGANGLYRREIVNRDWHKTCKHIFSGKLKKIMKDGSQHAFKRRRLIKSIQDMENTSSI